MKNLRFLLVGILCLTSIGLAKLAKADGIKPIDTSGDPVTNGPCTCTCNSVSITSATYSQFFQADGPLLGGANDILTVNVAYSMSPSCKVKIVVSMRALRYSNTDTQGYVTWYDPWTPLGNVTQPDATTAEISGGTRYDEGRIAWWEVQAYVVRVCDNTIAGWSSVVTVTP